ncbi:formyltransferase family protein [Dasania marina]|uniref:formyltransferase family protein n=1 Tax=Dasania marina TaxID=471499 RepID=UPI00035DA7D4|nr:formyltransferase family protein [Dasania marina]
MNILFLTGSHPRHSHIARQLHEAGMLNALIIEQREEHLPSPPADLADQTAKLFSHHFLQRANTEDKFFSSKEFPAVKTLNVSMDELNGNKTAEFIKHINPDIVISYGVHKLEPHILACAKGEKWNIHGGLSPWYRGAITHFWPSYMLEPQMTGMTVHDLSQQLDAGSVIHQNAAPMVRGDKLHDIACRAVSDIAYELPKVIEKFYRDKTLIKKPQTSSGKLWLASDWRPAHLHMIYDYYNDQIVDAFLDGNFQIKNYELHRQFAL